MPFSIHGHRPSWVRRDPAATPDTRVPPTEPQAAPVKTYHLGLIKVKVKPQTTPLQAALLRQLAVNLQPSPPQSNRALLAYWTVWAQSGGAADGDRNEALIRMRDFLNQNRPDRSLNLAGLQLTSLPKHLPPTVETLDVSRNQLTRLPENLPPTLKVLDASLNQLTSLPQELPHSLEQLIAGGNALHQLPELPTSLVHLSVPDNTLRALPQLPASLVDLDASDNHLIALPELPQGLRTLRVKVNSLPELPNLPDSLTELLAYRNELKSLQDPLPLGLTTLAISSNQLTSLPSNLSELRSLRFLHAASNQLDSVPVLPPSLRELWVADNRLHSLPELPDSLTLLWFARNQISSLPDPLPRSLESIDASQNLIASLPSNITTQLGPHCTVDVIDNPLVQSARDDLIAAVNAQDYQGPTFIGHDLAHLPAAGVVRPLPEAVAEWYPPGERSAVMEKWNALSGTPGAEDFSRFLDRLRRSVNGSNPQLKHANAEWLSHLAEHGPLRDQAFAISVEAATRCDDFVASTLNRMKRVRLWSDVESGAFDERLPDLVNLARQMFRLDKLDTIAKAKVDSLFRVDETEVYLAYQVKLIKRLDLPLDTPDMQFFVDSKVTKADLDQAEAHVRASEETDFVAFLSADWPPWQSVLKRQNPAAHAAAEDDLIEAVSGDQFEALVTERLKPDGLEQDEGARTLMGRQLSREIELSIKLKLTASFFEERQLTPLLAPPDDH